MGTLLCTWLCSLLICVCPVPQCSTFRKNSLTCLTQQKVNFYAYFSIPCSICLQVIASMSSKQSDSKCPSFLRPAEIMTGDLLEDLMSSEGEFCQWRSVNLEWDIESNRLTVETVPCSVLAFTPPVSTAQRPRLHIQPRWDRRPVRPFRRPHPQPLTPGTFIGAEGKFLQNSRRYFSKKKKKTEQNKKIHVASWRCNEGQRSHCDLTKRSWTPLHRLWRAHWQ